MNLFSRTRLGQPSSRRFIYEWLLVAYLGVAVISLGALCGLTESIDHLILDRYLRLDPAPPLADIVVVEIDDESIAKLGRWPWPRSLHERLLDDIARAQPAAVVYDVLFIEASEQDAQLARAVAASPTYLPILLAPPGIHGKRSAIRPVAPLARAAAGLGHINLEEDSDGAVRSVALVKGDHPAWPQLTLPLARAIGNGTVSLRDSGGEKSLARMRETRALADNDEGRFLIPFSPLAAPYQKISFAALLESLPHSVLRGKIVLIGVTASGLYDRYLTPMSGELGPLPGVYVHATVLDALLTGREIDPASARLAFAVSLAPLVALLAGLRFLSPLRSLLLTALLCAVMVLFSAMTLTGLQLWITPVPAIAGLAVVCLIWNWRRLEMTLAHFRKELRRLAEEPYLLTEKAREQRELGGDVLEQHMALMAQAAQRIQDMKRFVWDSLDSMPEPILVSNQVGVVVIANHAARLRFGISSNTDPIGKLMHEMFGALLFVKTVSAGEVVDARVRAHWPAALDPTCNEFSALMEQGIEVRDCQLHDHLLRYAKCTNAQGEANGWIAGLVDVTALHAAERQREEALSLLSHDMRSPQASILALIEIERTRTDEKRVSELLLRIERYAKRSLALADDFVQLARAESQVYVFEPVSLLELVTNASDEVWPQAQAKQIRLDAQYDEQSASNWINADRSLLTRALVNILQNAVKYSPERTRIVCSVRLDMSQPSDAPTHVLCTVRDEGYGISAEQQNHMFERFQRFHETERPEVGGVGLGLAFVKTVVTRHGGDIRVVSAAGKGTALTVRIPIPDAAAAYGGSCKGAI
jgi:CHASE2 domain-containing sensor protein/signal transduction histidine kinase